MGVFNSSKQFTLPAEHLPEVANDVMDALRAREYEVDGKALMGGGWDISVTKGGTFKAVLGLKTALKLNLSPRGSDRIVAEASVGIFGQQAVPTIIMLFVAWPVVIPQIWGLIQQSRLDDTVMNLIAESIQRRCPQADQAAGQGGGAFCAQCGAALAPAAKFCSGCGAKAEA